MKASKVSSERGLYTLLDPPDGLDGEAVDRIFSTIEPVMPSVIRKLEQNHEDPEDREILLDYVAMLGSRHPGYFREIVEAHTAHLGVAPLTGDQLTMARLQVLQNALDQVRGWHWRVVDSPEDATGFVLNDRGFSYVGQDQRPGRALLVPLSRRTSLLGFVDERTGFASRYQLTPMSVAWLNALTWIEAPLEAYAHPDDGNMLARLGDPTDARSNRTGPYRGSNKNLLDG